MYAVQTYLLYVPLYFFVFMHVCVLYFTCVTTHIIWKNQNLLEA